MVQGYPMSKEWADSYKTFSDMGRETKPTSRNRKN